MAPALRFFVCELRLCLCPQCSTNKNTDTCSGASSCAEWSRLQTARAFSITAIIVTPVAGALIGFRAFDPTSGNPNNGKFGGAVAAIVALFGLIATAAFVGALDAQDVDHDFVRVAVVCCCLLLRVFWFLLFPVLSPFCSTPPHISSVCRGGPSRCSSSRGSSTLAPPCLASCRKSGLPAPPTSCCVTELPFNQ